MTSAELDRRVTRLEKAIGQLAYQRHSKTDAAHLHLQGKAELAELVELHTQSLPPEPASAPRVLWAS